MKSIFRVQNGNAPKLVSHSHFTKLYFQPKPEDCRQFQCFQENESEDGLLCRAITHITMNIQCNHNKRLPQTPAFMITSRRQRTVEYVFGNASPVYTETHDCHQFCAHCRPQNRFMNKYDKTG